MNVWAVTYYATFVGSYYIAGVYSTPERAERSVYGFLSSSLNIPIWEDSRHVEDDYIVIYYRTMDPEIAYTVTLERHAIDADPI